MELVDIIRHQYKYKDEYIIEKSFTWLYNAVALIQRRKYNDNLTQAILIGKVVGKLFGSKDKIEYYDELNQQPNFIEEEDDVADVESLKSVGLGN